MAVGAAWAAIHRRKSAGRRRQISPPRRSCARLPDGYTLLMAVVVERHQRDALRQSQFQFHPRHRAGRQHRPHAACLGGEPVVSAKTVPEFIAYAKANPGKINMATAGIGSSPHLAGELFMMMTGVKLVPVHYRGLYVPDLLAGQVQLAFSPIPTTIEQVRAGKLRALAVTTPTRSPALPNVPTIGEFVAGLRGKRVERRGRAEGHTCRDHRQAP